MTDIIEKTESSIFKTKYYSNPEYKKKHIAYVSEKITCECGTKTARCNMYKHIQTNKHKQLMELINKTKESPPPAPPQQTTERDMFNKKNLESIVFLISKILSN
jgi:hypothetical protein